MKNDSDLKNAWATYKISVFPSAFWASSAAGVKIVQQHLNLCRSWDEELTIDGRDSGT